MHIKSPIHNMTLLLQDTEANRQITTIVFTNLGAFQISQQTNTKP